MLRWQIYLLLAALAGIMTWWLLVHYTPQSAVVVSSSESRLSTERDDPELVDAEPGVALADVIQDFISQEKYSEAISFLYDELRNDAVNMEYYWWLSEVYWRQGNIQKLEHLHVYLYKNFPDHVVTAILNTKVLLWKQEWQEAITFLQSSAHHNPSLDFYQAILLSLQNNYTASRDLLRGVVDNSDWGDDWEIGYALIVQQAESLLQVYGEFDTLTAGENAHLLVVLGKELAEQQELSLATALAEVAIKEDANYIDAWIVRGYVAYLRRDYVAAIGDLRYAYELDPLRAETHYFLALALQDDGQYDEAVLFFEKSLDNGFAFGDEIRWQLVDILTKQKKYDRALELYRELLLQNPDPKKFSHALHTAIDLSGKPEIALEFASVLVKQNPEDIFSLNLQAWSLIANQQLVAAEKVLDKALDLSPENPRTWLNIGLLKTQEQKFSLAKSAYKKAHEFGYQKPEHASIVNLAAEKYNELLVQENRPPAPSAPDKPSSSP